MTRTVNRYPRSFQLTWLTSTPWLRGQWVAVLLSLIPAVLCILSLLAAPGLSGASGRVIRFSSALFLSLTATLIQLPRYVGRAELTREALTVTGPLTGKRRGLYLPRQAIEEASFAPLRRPPRWMPFGWALVELMCAAGAISAGVRLDGRGEHWTWLTALALGLCFWPWMVARWQAEMQVVLTYRRPGKNRPGLIRAWATPHQAQSLVNRLLGKANWQEPVEEEE
jgi:hypothetical protein